MKHKLTLKELFSVVVETFTSFFKVKGIHHGAAISYYALFAMVPLIYLSVTIFGRFIGSDNMQIIISDFLTNQIGVKEVDGILNFENSLNLQKKNLIMDIVGIVSLLLACSALMVAFKVALNKYIGVKEIEKSKSKAILDVFFFRGISLLFISGTTLLVIALYFTQLLLVSLGEKIFGDLSSFHWILSNFTRHLLSFLTNIIIFTFIFRFVNDAKIKWRPAFFGAIFTSIILYFSQLAIKYYLSNFFFGANGGIAGSILVIMLWVFYSSLIIFLGARFVAVYDERVELKKNSEGYDSYAK